MRRLVLFVVLVAALAAPVAAEAATPFSHISTAVEQVQAYCLQYKSPRVYVQVRVRYPDVSEEAEAAYANGRHRVRSLLTLRDRNGALLARDVDRGTAQAVIPGLSSYAHTHDHELGRAASRRVMAGGRCNAGRNVRVHVGARQTLIGATGANGATASQRTSATVTVGIQLPRGLITFTNGCQYLGIALDCQGVDLSRRKLDKRFYRYSDFSSASFANSNLSEAGLEHVVMHLTVLDGANLRNAKLDDANLTSASLRGADLTGAKAPFANFANANFSGAKLAGADLSGANLPGAIFESTGCDDKTVFPAAFPHVCRNGVVAAP